MTASLYCNPCSRLVAVEADEKGAGPCPSCGQSLTAPSSADVFISYASADHKYASRLAEIFGKAGIGHWRDAERIDVGETFYREIPKALEVAKCFMLVLSHRTTESGWVRKELTEAIRLKLPILPLAIERFELPADWRFMLGDVQRKDMPEDLLLAHADEIVDRVRSVLLNDAARGAAPALDVQPIEPRALAGVDPRVSPYVGPRPFTARMADKFFGRHHEAMKLLGKISQSRVVLVYAPSGAGKSSLLNTVIAQSLEDRRLDVMLNARVGGALPSNTKPEDIPNIFSYSAIVGLDHGGTPNPRWRLAEYLRSIGSKPGTSGRVIVFDQFEEIFTQHRERFEERPAFVGELVEALNDDPELRVILAARQEFLADIDPLADLLPPEYAMERFALQRLAVTGALEAVIRPAERFAAFAPGVAERIVAQLNTIKITRSDGVVVEKAGEFIELVHLQIVCDRLWGSLPRGIKTIEMTHLEQAAGDGKAIDEFVVTALDSFYDQTLDQIVNSAATRAHGGFSKELIRLGCMKFVTAASTRTMVQRANGRTGRLPDWIVEQLENSHLLRAEQRGGSVWYELSHDSLAEPVGRQMDRDVTSLLFASDLLNKVLENALRANAGALRGYFKEHRDVLTECRPFHGQSGLFSDEAELVFRASLTAGQDMGEWSRRLRQDYPDVRANVLADALSSRSAGVRANAAALLAREPDDKLVDRLAALALHDADDAVRRTAAEAIALLDRPQLFSTLTTALSEAATRAHAVEALTRVRIAVDESAAASSFDSSLEPLPRATRRSIARRARHLRIREGLPMLPFVVLPAAALAAVAASLFKWLPGLFNWALGQATPSAAIGVFQGVVAGMVWAGLITLGITLYHVVFGRRRTPKGLFSPPGTIVAGAAGGFAGSMLLVITIAGIYAESPLLAMAWVTRSGVVRFYSFEFWSDLFITARYGWPYLITGTGLGVGMALATNSLRSSTTWQALLADTGIRMSGVRDTVGVVKRIMPIVLPHAWPLLVGVGAASVLAFFVPDIGVTIDPTLLNDLRAKTNAADLWHGLVGDGMTQVIGAYFGICGMALGMIVMRRGLHLEPRTGQG